MQIIIFTGSLDFNVRWNVVTLAERFPACRFVVLLHAPQKSPALLLRNQWRNVKRHGWRWIPYQASEIGQLAIRRLHASPAGSPDRPGQQFSTSAVESHPRIEIKRVAAINSEETCAWVRARAPDLGVALGAPILKPALFTLPRLGTINLHKGRLPFYRGMPPAFWELRNGESSVGCTVHQVEAGLDTGDILLEGSVPVDRFATLGGMKVKLDRLGVEMVCDAVCRMLDGSAVFTPQAPGGATNTRPPLAVEAQLVRKLAAKDPSRGSPVKVMAKRLMFSAYARAWMPFVNWMHGRAGNQRIIILLYHRVSDEFRDNVTIGIEQFDQHMAYVARNFVTVSLKEIVEGRIPKNTSKPVIAVSFDDGYLDNYENAAPVLLKHQVPCTFFISTEKIRDNKPFDHDLRALGFGLDNMSWNQVRQMRDWGLHFGSHTRNHVNLAEIGDDLALEELEGSFNDIRKELGQEQVFIAYPYGRKHHITAARVDMMKKLGYAACFSAYGGLNASDLDLFNIRRIGVNWAFDMTALQARLRGWDTTQ
jgi:peptidoglycan/xylan/chitin deacetylase (PgdA/CDA1 family)/folate-dependent phosphoribosylglycinamide formyltransferase PurN